MELVIVGVALEVIDGLLPVRREYVLVLTVQSLVDIGPWPCVQFGGGITLRGKLQRRAEVSNG